MKDEWYTQRWVFDAMGLQFDLDVAAPPTGGSVPAHSRYTALDDGLAQPWHGSVWCNPPFSRPAPWGDKWAAHGHGVFVGLYNAGAKWVYRVIASADHVVLVTMFFDRPGRAAEKPASAGLFVAFRGVGVAPAKGLAAAGRGVKLDVAQ